MSEAPERMWIDPDILPSEWHKRYHCDVEYVRADRIEELQARVAELQAELETARQDAMEDVLQSVGEMLAGTLEVDVSPVARKKIRAAIIRAFASRPDAMKACVESVKEGRG